MISFIILHYMSFETTKECADLLFNNFGNSDIRIILVDNASPNDSGKKLQEYYKNENRCTVIINEENYGFAVANNIGYSFAKKTYDSDFIVVMNNDVYIYDMNFLDKVNSLFEKTGFYLLGPDILSKKTGFHQNPLRKYNYTLEELELFINYLKKQLKYPVLYFIKEKLHFWRVDHGLVLHKQPEPVSDYNNPVLHGACIIYSRKYIEHEDEAFCPGTFMYGEEYLLHHKCIKNNYNKIIYDISIQVTHLDGFSTDLMHKSGFGIFNKANYKKFIFQRENMLKSRNLLRDEMFNNMIGDKNND